MAADGSRPLLIAHRGASGERPEHTLAAYQLAIAQGADCIEPDLVMTRDGVLVARHENEIGSTTNVADHPEFAHRRRRQLVDGVAVEGWFIEDFTFDELQHLRARERLPALRPASAAHDDRYVVPAFTEILEWLAAVNRTRAASGQPPVAVYPETKHPSHFRALGLPLEDALLQAMARHGGGTPVYVQSFETGNLRELRGRCDCRLVQLVELDGGPWDGRDSGLTYDALCTPAGLAEVATWADVLGVHKQRVLPRNGEGRLLPPTRLVEHAHAAGLAVHAWTFRAENVFLPTELRRGGDDAAHGDLAAEIRAHLEAGIDGLFCDHPRLARAAIDAARGP